MAHSNVETPALYHDDNLPILRALPAESIHLIATDPPFNTGREISTDSHRPAANAQFKDQWSWERDVDPEWPPHLAEACPTALSVIETSRATYGDDMATFLCFMAIRLIEMRRILKDDGSIYVHCDPTSSHYLKQLMDAIFGVANFRNEIIWAYGLGGSSPKRFSRKHDVILFYTKSDRYTFNKPQTPATSQKLKGQMKGATDVWDIPSLNNMAKERTGYPTQETPRPLRTHNSRQHQRGRHSPRPLLRRRHNPTSRPITWAGGGLGWIATRLRLRRRGRG